MSRLLFVVEQDTPRCYPIPDVVPVPGGMLEFLKTISQARIGKMDFASPSDRLWYNTWYTTNKGNIPEDSKMAGYHERKPDHLLSMAMLLALSDTRQNITQQDMITANRILTYTEKNMLTTFQWLGVKPVGMNHEKMLTILAANGGKMRYGDLLRRMIFYMDSMEFKRALITLEESGRITHRTAPVTQDGIISLLK